MNKRLTICLSILILLSMVFSTAAADLDVSENGNNITAIYYIAATEGDESILTSARYAVRAIAARWPEKQLSISRPDMRTTYNEIKKAEDGKVFSNVSKGSGGKVGLNAEAEGKLTNLANMNCDLWFIVPGTTAKEFVNNVQIMEKARAVLANPQSRVHIVFIGSVKETDLESSYMYTESLPIDRMILKQDFQANTIAGNSDDSSTHTGDYFIASLYGTPLDISIEAETMQFTMPDNGRVLILSQGENAGIPSVKDEQGNVYPTDLFSIDKIKERMTGYQGAYTRDQLARGQKYTVQHSGSSVKIYWYPDFGSIQPSMETAEEWERGEQQVVLKMEKVIGNPKSYIVRIKYGENGEEAVPRSLSYNEEQGCWQTAYTVGVDVINAELIPSVSIRMGDGNQAWSWNEKEEYKAEKIIQNRAIRIIDETNNRNTIYYYQDRFGSFSGRWDEYFAYNPSDNPEFSITADDTAKAAGWDVNKDARGFSVTYKPSSDSERPDCEIELAAEKDGVRKTHRITVSLQDVNALISDQNVTCSPENLEARVGTSLEIKAAISPETAAQWNEAMERLPGLSGPGDLTLEAELAIDEDNTIVKTKKLEKAEDNSWNASCTIDPGENRKSGEYSLTWRLKDQEGTNWLETTRKVKVINSIPTANTDKLEAARKEFELSGIPGQFTPKDIIPEVFGENSLFDLFGDDETEIKEIHLIIKPASGIAVNGESPETEEYDDKITNTSTLPQIQATDTGDHDLIITASDGVNESEPFEIRISVKSSFVRIATYAGIGAAALLLLLIAVLIIRQKRKPSFDNIRIKAYISGDTDTEHSSEMLEKSQPIPMGRYQKQGVDLATIMILARQPEVSASVMEVLEDIIVYPGRYEEFRLVFGKKAMSEIGRQNNQEMIQRGHPLRFRVENSYIQIENSQ